MIEAEAHAPSGRNLGPTVQPTVRKVGENNMEVDMKALFLISAIGLGFCCVGMKSSPLNNTTGPEGACRISQVSGPKVVTLVASRDEHRGALLFDTTYPLMSGGTCGPKRIRCSLGDDKWCCDEGRCCANTNGGCAHPGDAECQ